jgi:hypothetical protein
MERTRVWTLGLAVAALAASLGAAPAAPTSLGVERTIARIRADWAKPGAPAQPNAAGWNALFDRLGEDLRAYASAPTEDDRLRVLDRIYRISASLRGVAWRPAAELEAALREWLRPRVSLAWAIRRVRDAVRGLPPSTDPAITGNRERWFRFTDDQLGAALRGYEGATTASGRQDALKRVYAALNALDAGNRARPWVPSLSLETALNDLFNRPNLDASADVATLSPALNHDVAETGPIWFKGQLSYVTAGPKTGFGLLASDDGIAFYNSQMMTSVTPIRGFQDQIASDPQGRRVAKLYQFNATSQDDSQLTIYAILRTTGLQLIPAYAHNVSASIGSVPTAGNGLGRMVASLIGFNQRKITNKVYEGAVPKIGQGVVEGAAELGGIRVNEAAAKQNATLQQYLVGNNTLHYKNFAITNLSLRSRPEYALIGGTVQWRGAAEQVGADAPQPASFQTIEPGVTADVHLSSLLTNLARGFLQTPDAEKVTNLMIVTKKVPPGTPPREGIVTKPDTDFPTFLKAVEDAQAANDPKVMAIRVKRPGRSPEFTSDARGFLVALVHDFLIEVPAPGLASRGGIFGPAARIYRISAPNAEISVSFHITPPEGNTPMRISGRVEEFDPGQGAQVHSINEDESQATPLNAFTRIAVLRTFAARLQGQPLDVPLPGAKLPNMSIRSVSALDPSGWIRIVLAPGAQAPAAVAQPAARPQPQPAAAPTTGVAVR